MMRYDKFKSNNSAPSFLIFRNLSLDPTPSPPGIKSWFRLPKYLQPDLRLSFPKPRQTSTIVLFSQKSLWVPHIYVVRTSYLNSISQARDGWVLSYFLAENFHAPAMDFELIKYLVMSFLIIQYSEMYIRAGTVVQLF